jgi:threonine synthase
VTHVQGLKCKECGQAYAVEAKYVCEYCFGPLEVAYDYEAIRGRMTRASIAAGPASIWRYAPLLPANAGTAVTLHEGFTPLVRAERLGRALGLDNLYVKNDAVNPTFSFKDRVVSIAASKAREFGFETLSCASTGNLAGAVSAYGAVGGLKAVIFIPADLEPGKVTGATVYGATIVAVRGSYDDVNRLCSEISNTRKWAFVNINLRPFYSEGSKTLAYEVAEQLGWRAPDHVVVPIASGSLLTKIHKGFQEFQQVGLIPEARTRVSGAQGEGCAPVVTAFKTGAKAVRPVIPKTLAKSIAIGNPADGGYALDLIRKTEGGAESAADVEIVEGIELLARTEGIFTETAGGVTVAALRKLAAAGVIRREELTVAYITGNGFKTAEVINGRFAPPVTIDANLKAFEAQVK